MTHRGKIGPSRRALFGIAVGGATALVAGGAATLGAGVANSDEATTDPHPVGRQPPTISAGQAWAKLMDGNARFVAGRRQHPHGSPRWRESLVTSQRPFAVIVGCADSRVPPELVFDEGLGGLFVIRSAGQVLDAATIGSIEYAIKHLAVPLVVVLGHENCGAIGATIDVIDGVTETTGNIAALVRSIEPAVRATPKTTDRSAFLAACVAEQARRSATYLYERSTIVSDAVADRAVTAFSATYQLSTGRVVKL